MHNPPKISVAIAVYNKEMNILSTLNSVLNQSYAAQEIIIVNDGSTDNSERLILSLNDKRIRYFAQKNKGAAAARNKAIQSCSYPYIALIDADDLWHVDFLKNIANAITKYPQQKVFSTAIKTEVASQNPFKSTYQIPTMDSIGIYNYFKASSKTSIIHSSAVVIHEDVFHEVGYFDKAILSGQDTDLWIRIGLEFSIVFIPKHLATYRYVQNSLSRSGVAIKDKLDFSKYADAEKTNPALKKFLDLNRYSLAIYAREKEDMDNHFQLKRVIDRSNLNWKQNFILSAPKKVIWLLKRIQSFLEGLGWKTTSF